MKKGSIYEEAKKYAASFDHQEVVVDAYCEGALDFAPIWKDMSVKPKDGGLCVVAVADKEKRRISYRAMRYDKTEGWENKEAAASSVAWIEYPTLPKEVADLYLRAL